MLTRARLILMWVAACLTTLVASYAFVTAGTLLMLVGTGAWSHEKAGLWTWIAVFILCVFGVLARFYIVALVRYYEQLRRHPGNRDRPNS